MASESAMKTSVLLREVVAAAKLGQKSMARNLLREIHDKEPLNEQALMWSAALAESPEEAMSHLERVLEINPKNTQALNVLAVHRLNRPKRDTTAPPPPPPQQQQGNGHNSYVAQRPFSGQANLSVPTSNVQARSTALTEEAPVVHEHHVSREQPTSYEQNGSEDMGPKLVRLSEVVRKQDWQCAFCRTESEVPLDRCGLCGGIQVLEDLSAFSTNRGLNESLVEEAILRIRRELAAEESFSGQMSMAKALLNLNRSAEALSHLRKANELHPNDGVLKLAVRTLENRTLVMAVDDSLTVRKVVNLTLERNGYRVITAADGMEALALLNDHTPHLILLDITMPRMDGYQVCKVIKQNPYTKSIPVVMLSGNDGFFDKMKGKLAGATDYLTKPFKEDTLLASLKKYVKPRKDSGK